MPYWVYMLTNKSGTLYTGVTNNLERRVYEHTRKLIPGFSSRYNLDKLIYFAEFKQIDEAILAEKRIKGWTRKKKVELIKTINPEFKNLLGGN